MRPVRNETVEFLLRKFRVTEHVLYPRIETESLVRIARDFIRAHHIRHIIDIWTGSWVIAISLGKECDLSSILAVDISQKALEVAKDNALNLGCENIQFLQSNLLESHILEIISQWRDVPIFIAANLPYISRQEIALLGEWVLQEDPHEALFGWEETGFELYTQLLSQIKELFSSHSFGFIGEIGFNQWSISEEQSKGFGFKQVKVLPDLCGHTRFFLIDNII